MNNRFTQIKKQIGKFIANFSVTEEDGKEYIFDGDTIHEGLSISTYDENGDIIPLPDGEYSIQGERVLVSDGCVSKMLDKESKVDDNVSLESESKDEPKQDDNDLAIQLASALADNEALKAENEALKKELEQIKSVPMADPVPQRTNMSSDYYKDVPDNIKGTKFEKAYKIFNK